MLNQDSKYLDMQAKSSKRSLMLVYILGAGHCGSTLLNLLLNGHDEILGLSEFAMIKSAMKKVDNPEYFLNDTFWQEVRRRYENDSSQSFAEIDMEPPTRSWKRLLALSPDLQREIQGWTQRNELLLSCIAEQAGVDILVDASKSWQRLYVLRFSSLLDIKVIHLVRDGRAVVNSYTRKRSDFLSGMRHWMKLSLYAAYLRRKFDKEEWLRVYYEELCSDPEHVLRHISSFLEVDYKPRMLNYREAHHVGIRGNRMRYGNDDSIVLDERWKHELSTKHRLLFNLFGGWLNKCYKY